ncbi:MAG: hypothetical protein LBS23_03115 [Holosporaceae bacterium]|jgi:phosphoserine phosphatase|nr:hypothetical protein [Holosporaceae bacterium]
MTLASKKPICVDLDGTLIKDDVTMVAVCLYAKACVFNILKIIYWFLRGRAYLKAMLAKRVDINVASLNYNKKFLDFIITKKKEGYKIFLATACNEGYANKIADFLNIFDGVFASDFRVNLRATAKADVLVEAFGEKGFIYAGNSRDDIKVWNKSAEYILVTPSKSVLKKMHKQKYLLFA